MCPVQLSLKEQHWINHFQNFWNVTKYNAMIVYFIRQTPYIKEMGSLHITFLHF